MFTGKILLITGGTGTFGNAIVSQFLKTDIKEIRVFSRDENKQETQRLYYKNSKLKHYIGDVRNYDSLLKAMRGVDLVFHAAALKQVPSCEFFPLEAIYTNILGTENVINAAITCGVEKIIALSTDKAVYPISVMGMTKALMEKIVISKIHQNTSKTVFCSTRYGNVLCSRGSVIPLFISQIKKKEDITITNPNMTRFMMSIKDAINLVLFAFENGNNGDIFVQKAPATDILTLTLALKEIFKAENNIKIIGLRHGEKISETLIAKEEMIKVVDLGDYYKIPPDERSLDYDIYTNGNETNPLEEYNSDNTYRLSKEETIKMLLTLEDITNYLGD